MTRAARVGVLAILSIALHLHAQAPQPQPNFRGGTDLVQVDVSVLDRKRHPVRGLTVRDFTIFEDGQPRDIQAFSEVSLPDRLQPRDVSWTREVPSDVATNQTAQQEGGLLVILLDRTIPLGDRRLPPDGLRPPRSASSGPAILQPSCRPVTAPCRT